MENQLTPNNSMILEIRELLENARKNVAQQVNTQLLTTYWNIGRIIVEYEQQNQIRADYGKQTLRELSKELTREFGKGFSRSNLQNMRAFYLAYEKCQTVSGKLSWSHYCELLSITDENKRSFYEKESINSGWSVRELKRQIDSSLYERLLLSSGDANKEKVLSLAQKGVEINQPADIIRDPYVFEFLGVPENKPILESDLEKALVVQIEKFLLELGRGFMFVGTQQRVTLNNTHYYVDMVFYNKILRAYVLIELKTKKLTPEAAGQLNMYLNYYAAEVNDPDDNPPIGIILCTEKDSIAAEYALGGLSNNIFASRYVLYMPDKEQLIAQVEAVLKKTGTIRKITAMTEKELIGKSTFSGLSSMPASWLCDSGRCTDGDRCPAKNRNMRTGGFGRIDYLERVCTVNLRKLSFIMHQMRVYAQKTGLKPSFCYYKQWGVKREKWAGTQAGDSAAVQQKRKSGN